MYYDDLIMLLVHFYEVLSKLEKLAFWCDVFWDFCEKFSTQNIHLEKIDTNLINFLLHS